MTRALFFALLCAAAAACGGGDQPGNRGGAGNADNAALARLNLTSSAFEDEQPIPAEFTCEGADRSPPLAWGEPPAGTKSFALVADDPDAPSGVYRHWGAYDIQANARSIAAGQALGTQAVSDSGKAGYSGPCPPPGHGVHHYHFKLYALSVDRVGLRPNAKVAEVEDAAKPLAIGQGQLIGTYERK